MIAFYKKTRANLILQPKYVFPILDSISFDAYIVYYDIYKMVMQNKPKKVAIES